MQFLIIKLNWLTVFGNLEVKKSHLLKALVGYPKHLKYIMKLLNHIKIVMKKVGDMNVYTNHQNLSAIECHALNKLRKNRKIVIKPPDKGSVTLILSRENCIREAH